LPGTNLVSTGFGGQQAIIPASLRHFGTREHESLDELLVLLAPFDITIVYSGNNFAYQPRITGSEAVTGKENTCHCGWGILV
jgi:hypothetical protein